MALNAEQLEALKHLGYEWWMLRASRDVLQRLDMNGFRDPIRNALIESALIHGRLLIDVFFVREDTKGKPINARCGTWNSETLSMRREKCPAGHLYEWVELANHGVAHLTDQRTSLRNQWPIEDVIASLKDRVDELRKVLGAEMDHWPGDSATDTCLLTIPLGTMQSPAAGATGGILPGTSATIPAKPVKSP